MLYIITTGFNNKPDIKNTLKQLSSQTCREFKIVYVDDNSTDGTVEMIQNEYPDVIILHGNGNLWWSGANNKAIKYILKECDLEDDNILLLNNYLYFDNDYIERILDLSKEFPDTVISPVVLSLKDDSVISVGVKLEYENKYPIIKFLKEYETNKKFIDIDLTTGRAVLYPVKVIKKTGFF